MVIQISTIWVIVLYVGLAMVIGVIGRNRKLGGWAYFFASLALTPVLGLLMLAVSDPRRRRPPAPPRRSDLPR